MQAKSTIKMNMPKIRRLTRAAVTALELTGEALHTEVTQKQVIPRETGALQNEKTFVDNSDLRKGKISLVHEGPYARRLYYHPEYNFQTQENPNARGNWYEDWLPGGKREDFSREAFKAIYKEKGGV